MHIVKTTARNPNKVCTVTDQ